MAWVIFVMGTDLLQPVIPRHADACVIMFMDSNS